MKITIQSLLISITLYGCSKTPVEPNNPGVITPPATTYDSTWTLLSASGNAWLTTNISFNYNKDKTVSSISTSTGYFYLFYRDGKIYHINSDITNFNGNLSKTSKVFLYDNENRLTRVVEKSLSSYNIADMDDGNSYFSDTTISKYTDFDSLSYSATGQLVNIRQIRGGGVMAMITFNYDKVSDVAPKSMSYYHVQSGVPTLALDYTLVTNNMDQPGYKFFWFTAFLSINAPVTPKLMYNSSYAALVKKCIVSWTSYEYSTGSSPYVYYDDPCIYSFNSDSTVLSGHYINDNESRTRIQYYFKKQ